MAFLKDLLVMGPARFMEDIHGNITGNAATASQLNHGAVINFTGGATGSLNLDKLASTSYTVNLNVNWGNIVDRPSALKNPNSLTIQGNGTTLTNGVYDGSAAKTINITPNSIGALNKTTYEYNTEVALGQTGYVCIGKFPMYDSLVSVEIKSTTSSTYNGTLVIASQNINTVGGGTHTETVYGDPSNTLTSSIKIHYGTGSNVFSVYIQLPSWSKNLLHVQCVSLAGAPTDVGTTITAIPSNATITPVNALTNATNTWKHSIEGTAARAIGDSEGKEFQTNYCTLASNQTLSGAKTFSNAVTTIQNKLQLTRASGTGHGRISFYNNDYKTWFEYMSNPVSGGCPTGGTPSTLGTVDNWARRSLVENTAGYGWVWEACSNSHTGTPTPVMALSAASGHLRMTGPIDYANTSGGSLTRHYISAGGGYSTGSGRLGLKLVAIDQSDIQAGIGIDLTGLSYETCLSTGRKTDTTASYISFATHTNETTAYKRLGYFTASGAANPAVTFTVNGNIVGNKISLSTGAHSWIEGKTISNAAIGISTTQTSGSFHPILAVKSYSGNVWTIGGLSDNVGFYGYYAARTANGTDFNTVWNTANGQLTHSAAFKAVGTITTDSAFSMNQLANISYNSTDKCIEFTFA